MCRLGQLRRGLSMAEPHQLIELRNDGLAAHLRTDDRILAELLNRFVESESAVPDED